MSFLSQILVLLVEVAAFLLAVWLLFLLVRFAWRLWAQRSRPRPLRAKRGRRLHERPVPVDRRRGPRREKDLVDAALENRGPDKKGADTPRSPSATR